MADSPKYEVVLQLLARAFDEQPIPDGPHILDDQDLMARWSDDRLSENERQQVVEHLSLCPECRDVLSTLLDARLLQLPVEVNSESNEIQPNNHHLDLPVAGGETVGAPTGVQADPSKPATLPLAQHEPRHWERRGSFWQQPAVWGLAAAATLLLAVGVMFWRGGNGALGPRIARLEQQLLEKDLSATPADEILHDAESLLAQATRDEDLRRLRDVIERAAYQVADGKLRAGQPQDALAVVDRAANSGAQSGRLRNLQLQVEQGLDTSALLAMNDRLLQDWRFSLTGRQLGKSLPGTDDELTDSQRRWLQEYQRAVLEFPDSLELRLNYGRLLLQLKRYQEAAEQFESAIRIDSRNAVAHRALGTSYFLQHNRDEDALREFQAAADLDARDETTLVNLGVTLEKLNRPVEARAIWERLFRDTEDEQLRNVIAQRL